METLYQKAFALEKSFLAQSLPDPVTLLSENRKTGQSLPGLFSHCRPSRLCAQNCYACAPWMSRQNIVKKAVQVNNWLAKTPADIAAARIAAEIKWEGLLRFNCRGDFAPETVAIVNRVVTIRPDVKFCAYSRRFSVLKQISPQVCRVLSTDKTCFRRKKLSTIPADIKISWLKADKNEKIPNRVDIIHPINKKKALRAGDPRECPFEKFSQATCHDCLRCFTP